MRSCLTRTAALGLLVGGVEVSIMNADGRAGAGNSMKLQYARAPESIWAKQKKKEQTWGVPVVAQRVKNLTQYR